MTRKNKVMDYIRRGITYAASGVSVVVLLAIIIFVFVNGAPLFKLSVMLGDSANQTTTLRLDKQEKQIFLVPDLKDNQYFSSRYGVAFEAKQNYEGHPTIEVVYLDEKSPLLEMIRTGTNNEKAALTIGDTFYDGGGGILLWDDNDEMINFKVRDGAEALAQALDQTMVIGSMPKVILGTGLRGSIVATLYLIILTLIIALPIGVGTAIYLHELAPQNKVTTIIRSFVDMLTGIPSIIYGLMGAAFFIPLTQKLFGSQIQGGSIISGALTLAVIVLPTIIRATETSLDAVPQDYKLASLALGANTTQTTFKIMVPNSLPGILSATLLSIGRIMGESAALIYALGTSIRDDVSFTKDGTSLAVHIWSVMGGETPNFALASTISIIILVVVLSLNLIVKLTTHRLVKKFK